MREKQKKSFNNNNLLNHNIFSPSFETKRKKNQSHEEKKNPQYTINIYKYDKKKNIIEGGGKKKQQRDLKKKPHTRMSNEIVEGKGWRRFFLGEGGAFFCLIVDWG